MNDSIYRITLDMHTTASQMQLRAKRRDNARTIYISLTEYGNAYVISEECKANMTIRRPDGYVLVQDCAINYDESKISYEFSNSTTEVIGVLECELRLKNASGDIITSPMFTMLVEGTVFDGGDTTVIYHGDLEGRDVADQHPMEAIEGLDDAFDLKANCASPSFTGNINVGGTNTINGVNQLAIGDGNTLGGQRQTVIGDGNTVNGLDHIVVGGSNNISSGYPAIAVGSSNTVNSLDGVIGENNKATGHNSFVVGERNEVTGDDSYAVGHDNIVRGKGSSAEGNHYNVNGNYSHAEGGCGLQSLSFSTVGSYNNTIGVENGGVTVSTTTTSVNVGYINDVYNHVEGSNNTIPAQGATNNHAEGNGNLILSAYSHAEGGSNVSQGNYSHTEGSNNVSYGSYTHTEGFHNKALSQTAHAEGYGNIASGENSHAEGRLTQAVGEDSHAEGFQTKALYLCAHAEGKNTKAVADSSHAENEGNVALGVNSHAEGQNTRAEALGSHTEGQYTTAQGAYSHVEGYHTKTSTSYQHVQGQYNDDALDVGTNYVYVQGDGESAQTYTFSNSDYRIDSITNIVYTQTSQTGQESSYTYTGTVTNTSTSVTFIPAMPTNVKARVIYMGIGVNSKSPYAHIVGNGSYSCRSNAHTLDWDGTAEFAGDVKANACGGENPISLVEVADDVTTVKEDIDNLETDLDDLADDVTALQTAETQTERSLNMLWKLNKGQTYDIEETTESGTSDAPSGAEYFTVDEVYGNSTQNGTPSPSYPSEIVDVTEENFKVVGRNLVDTSVFEDRHSINGSGEYVPSSSTADITSSDTFFNLYGATSITISGVSGQSYLCFYNGTTFIDTRKPFTSTATLSVPSGATCFRIAIPIGSKSTLQVEKGNSATSYVPYETPQTRTMSYTLRGIGDYKDVMDVESGKIVRKVANTVLTKDSDWVKFNSDNPLYFVRFTRGGYLNTNDWIGISNYYTGKENKAASYITNYEDSTFAFNYGSTNYRVMFRNDACATVEEFKNAIPNDGISIEYVLEEYTEESISADDIAFLRGLENLSADHTITVTDQNGNDISYLVEWIIKLSEVV